MLLDAGLAFPGDLRRGEHPRVGHFKDDVAEGAYLHDQPPTGEPEVSEPLLTLS